MDRFQLVGAGQAITLAVLTVVLLAANGCVRQRGIDPSPFNTPPLNAYALSGGKITQFIPTPGLPNSSTDKAMLKASRQLTLNSSAARSAFVIFSSREGKIPVPSLIIGNQIIVSAGFVIRNLMIPDQSSSDGTETLYPKSDSSIVLKHGSKQVKVGKETVYLKNLVLVADDQTFMTLPDVIAVFHTRDLQRGNGHEIKFDKIIYDISDYHR